MSKRARQVNPCVLFFDEIDSFARKRGIGGGVISDSNEGLLNTLLMEMDGIEDLKNIVVIAATNRPDMLDSALLRPGRFDRLVLVPVPDEEGRLAILKIHTKNMPLAKNINLNQLSKKLEGYSGADIESLYREAAMLALREDKEAKIVELKHFNQAEERVPPSVTKSQAETYRRMEKEYLKSAKAALEKEVQYLG
jgi:transitional endoplasmic reticulum ATPase